MLTKFVSTLVSRNNHANQEKRITVWYLHCCAMHGASVLKIMFSFWRFLALLTLTPPCPCPAAGCAVGPCALSLHKELALHCRVWTNGERAVLVIDLPVALNSPSAELWS